jgi:hypothetical protein
MKAIRNIDVAALSWRSGAGDRFSSAGVWQNAWRQGEEEIT